MRYFRWKLKFFSNILSVVIVIKKKTAQCRKQQLVQYYKHCSKLVQKYNSTSHSTIISSFTDVICVVRFTSLYITNKKYHCISCAFGHIHWRNLNGKLHFLCSVLFLKEPIFKDLKFKYVAYFSYYLDSMNLMEKMEDMRQGGDTG